MCVCVCVCVCQEEMQETLRQLGEWMGLYGHTIYKTRGSPPQSTPMPSAFHLISSLAYTPLLLFYTPAPSLYATDDMSRPYSSSTPPHPHPRPSKLEP